jgi:hypothetical protein
MTRDYLKEISEISSTVEKEMYVLIDKCIIEEKFIKDGDVYDLPEHIDIPMVNIGSDFFDCEMFTITHYQPAGNYKTLKGEYTIPKGGILMGEYIHGEKEMFTMDLDLKQMILVVYELRNMLELIRN